MEGTTTTTTTAITTTGTIIDAQDTAPHHIQWHRHRYLGTGTDIVKPATIPTSTYTGPNNPPPTTTEYQTTYWNTVYKTPPTGI